MHSSLSKFFPLKEFSSERNKWKSERQGRESMQNEEALPTSTGSTFQILSVLYVAERYRIALLHLSD